jgi:sulfate transport system ATP-binding protein
VIRGEAGYEDADSVFVRPHDFELSLEKNGTSTPAIVRRVTHLGWEIQVELALPEEEAVIAHLSREEFARLNLHPNQTLFIKPQQAKVFVHNYEI